MFASHPTEKPDRLGAFHVGKLVVGAKGLLLERKGAIGADYRFFGDFGMIPFLGYVISCKTSKTALGDNLSLNQIIGVGTSLILTPAFSKFNLSEMANIKLSDRARRT
jgi:hypothetical protein